MAPTVDGKGEAILEGAKAMSDPVVCEKLMRAIILDADYDAAINMSREDRRRKLNRAIM